MDYEKFDVIEFENGEYVVLNVIKFKNNTYLYLVNNDESKKDVSIVKVIINNGVADYVYIDDDKEFEYIFNRLIVDDEDIIKDVLASDKDKENDN